MMLYTRKGDSGKTTLFDTKKGLNVSKSSQITEVLGSLDEVNSFLGLCKVRAQVSGIVGGKGNIPLEDILEEMQQNLFLAQAEIAGSEKKITKDKVVEMERLINAIEKELPPITGFTISGGTELSALLDVARTMARRMERAAVALHESGERNISPHTRSHLNRISSLLFALARLANYKSGIKEEQPRYK